MAEFTVKRIAEMETLYAGAVKRARAELGVTSFGISVIDFPPHANRYPEHSHDHDGQEEVYLALAGSGTIEIDGERHPLDTETMVRVAPGARRKIVTGDEPLRLLALGGVPGRPYEPPQLSELGAPDPLAAGDG